MQVRIKICGITTPADGELAAALGVDLIGLNFYPKSPRFIDEATARSILKAMPTAVEPVALFVNEPTRHIQDVTQRLNLNTVQTHGDLMGSGVSATRWIPAFSVRDANSLLQLQANLERMRAVGPLPHAVLIDAHVPGLFGGTGQVAPWHLLSNFNPGVPLILAGGLTPENVAEAIRIVRPYAVDVASGVESSPGKKDNDKLRRFIDAVHRASGD
jgi:phosphoribosylanthranilate isomerase